MSDIGIARRIAAYYDQSLPPELIGQPNPRINSLVPSTAVVGVAFDLTVNGANFTAASVIEAVPPDGGDSVSLVTVFVSATVLTSAAVTAPTVGTWSVTVRDGEGESNSVAFEVTAVVATAELVSGWTIEQVKAFVVDHPDQLAEVYEFEIHGKGRATLLAWLDALLDEEAAAANFDPDEAPDDV